MIKDFILSFRDNIKERATNPFLATYLVIWIIRNWDFVYTMFNFDPGESLECRIRYIRLYFDGSSFLLGIVINVGWTFGVLVFTYLVLSISRILVNFFDKQVKPLIYKWTDSKSIVLKSTYDLVIRERDELQTKLDRERDSKSKLEATVQGYEQRIIELKSKIDSSESTEENLSDELSYLQRVYNKLLENNEVLRFKAAAVKIHKGLPFGIRGRELDAFIELGLMTLQSEDASGTYFKLTEEGQSLMKHITQLEL